MARGYPDYEGNKLGIYDKPFWAVYEGLDKNFILSGVKKAYGGEHVVRYVIPTGKTLFVTHATFCMFADAVADADSNQIIELVIYNFTTSAYEAIQGGNGGGFFPLPTPLIFTAGEEVGFSVVHRGNHDAFIFGVVRGYEI